MRIVCVSIAYTFIPFTVYLTTRAFRLFIFFCHRPQNSNFFERLFSKFVSDPWLATFFSRLFGNS